MQEKNKKKNSNTYISHNINETEEFAISLAKKSNPKDIFCLEGDLGVGKTVIAKSFGKFFNLDENITSPTFNILKTYNIKNNKINRIHHFDLYRIKNIDELYNIGFEDYINDDNAIILIEWPEVCKNLLPKKYKKIKIEKMFKDNIILENERKIEYEEIS